MAKKVMRIEMKGKVLGGRVQANKCAYVTVGHLDESGDLTEGQYELSVVPGRDGIVALFGCIVEIEMTFTAPEAEDAEPAKASPEPEEKPAKKGKKDKKKKEKEVEAPDEDEEPKKKGKKKKDKKGKKKKKEEEEAADLMETLLIDVDGLDEEAITDLEEDGFLTVGSVTRLTNKEFKKKARLLKKSERNDLISVLADHGWNMAEVSAGADEGDERGDEDKGIETLKLSARPNNALLNAGLTTLAKVQELHKRDLLKLAGMGRGGIVELCSKMHLHGYPIKGYVMP